MFIFGFPITQEDAWDEDPFLSDGKLPENEICEVCHVYTGVDGAKYIGIEFGLGISQEDMEATLSPFSADLDVRKVRL